MKLTPEMQGLVRHSPLIQAFDDPSYNLLMENASVHKVGEGSYVFRQGDPAEELFICAEGCIKLFRLTPNGDEKIIDIIQHGNSFAEAVLFMGGRYPVHAVALKPSVIVGIDGPQYMGFLRGSSELCVSMMGLMSRRMHWLLNEVDRLTLHNATFRLAAYLLEMYARGGHSTCINLAAPKHVIASRLSIKPETFSRILKRLSESKLIRVGDHSVELLNVEELESLVRVEL